MAKFPYKADVHATADSNVRSLQKNLNQLRPLAEERFLMSVWGPVAEDGCYGPKTAEAVMGFQRVYNCSPYDGIYGTGTDTALKKALSDAKIKNNAKPVASASINSSNACYTPADANYTPASGVCSSSASYDNNSTSEIPSCSINYTPASASTQQDDFMCTNQITDTTKVENNTVSINKNEVDSFLEKLRSTLIYLAKKAHYVFIELPQNSVFSYSNVLGYLSLISDKMEDLTPDFRSAYESIHGSQNVQNLYSVIDESKSILKKQLDALGKLKIVKAVKSAGGEVGYLIDLFLSFLDFVKLYFKNYSKEEFIKAFSSFLDNFVWGFASIIISGLCEAAVIGTWLEPSKASIGFIAGLIVYGLFRLTIHLLGGEEGSWSRPYVEALTRACEAMEDFADKHSKNWIEFHKPTLDYLKREDAKPGYAKHMLR